MRTLYGERMSDFGKELLKLRTAKSWTLREVEKRSEVSRQTVLRAEEGEFISLDITLKLFSIYNLSETLKRKMMNIYVDESVKRATLRRDTKKKTVKAKSKPAKKRAHASA